MDVARVDEFSCSVAINAAVDSLLLTRATTVSSALFNRAQLYPQLALPTVESQVKLQTRSSPTTAFFLRLMTYSKHEKCTGGGRTPRGLSTGVKQPDGTSCTDVRGFLSSMAARLAPFRFKKKRLVLRVVD